MKTWEITVMIDGEEYLEAFFCGTLEGAEKFCNEKEKETGKEYYVNFPSANAEAILTW